MTSNTVRVVVGLVLRGGQCLIARRAIHQHQGGLWEFPGGKCEVGETDVQALARELFEEVGLSVISSEPLFTIEHDYGDKRVDLLVQRVIEFSGEAYGKEGQECLWVAVKDLTNYEFPAANQVILQYLFATPTLFDRTM